MAVKEYPNWTPQELQQNLLKDPWETCEPVRGWAFPMIDKVARNLGCPPTKPTRLQSALLYSLYQANGSSGHTYVPWTELAESAREVLTVQGWCKPPSSELLKEAMHVLEHGRGRVVVDFAWEKGGGGEVGEIPGETRCYTSGMYRDEVLTTHHPPPSTLHTKYCIPSPPPSATWPAA